MAPSPNAQAGIRQMDHRNLHAVQAQVARRGPTVRGAVRSVLIACALWCLPVAAIAAQGGARPLFDAPDELVVRLQAPWPDVLRKRKGGHAPRHKGELLYIDADGIERRLDVTVETRGLTRLRVCRFPPLRLRFDKASTQGTLFDGQRELKMVTHCRQGDGYAQYYVQEALAYRIYNAVTEQSYRIRPLSVTYEGAPGVRPEGAHFAFLIEDTADVRRRIGLQRSPRTSFEPGDFDALQLSRFMLFQYLIGNTDWDVLSGPQADACCHNVSIAGSTPGGRVVPLPYDFDSAGMVDAGYAAPPESLPIKDVKQRLFRGFCVHNHALDAARAEFLGHRTAIFGLVRDDRRLSASRRAVLNAYFEAFYATLGDDARFRREVIARCRK